MENLRVSADIDSNSPLAWLKCLILGTYHCKRLPCKFRRTSKGIHLIWSGMDIDEGESLEIRRMIGDDRNRIALDAASPKRVKQVLFSEKVITCNGFILTSSCKRVGIDTRNIDLSKCPLCGLYIKFCVDYRTEEKDLVEVIHENGSPPCIFKPKRRLL